MDTILVLCQSRRQSALIARTLRYRQVYSLPLALDSRAETVLSYAPKGIVLSANDGMDNALAQVDPALLSAGVPVLALGGMVPALCRFYGGEASPSACPRFWRHAPVSCSCTFWVRCSSATTNTASCSPSCSRCAA